MENKKQGDPSHPFSISPMQMLKRGPARVLQVWAALDETHVHKTQVDCFEIVSEPIHSDPCRFIFFQILLLLLFPSPSSSTAAPPMATLPVSLILVWKTTLLPPLPSRHISVTSVWPGSTVLAKRTLMFLKGPNAS